MIAFVTLFLGLAAGAETVELTVGDGVAAVELRLDGRQVADLRGPPWTAECDFGSELAPHELVAIAYDDAGREVGRAEQSINLPRPRSQVELLPLAAGSGPPDSARVLWQSVDGARPDSVTITFDGAPLEVGDPNRVELPAYDPDRIHLLKAELRFGYSLAHSEIVIGGRPGETVGSELTAFPVLVASGNRPPSAEEMAGWFLRSGRRLRVLAIDRRPADLIVVQDQTPRILGQLDRLRRDLAGGPESDLLLRPGPTGIKRGDRLRVIVPYGLPVARPASAGDGAGPGRGEAATRRTTPRELFPISRDLATPDRTPTSVGVGRRLVAAPRATGLLAATFYRAPPAGVSQRLADAVAEAGRAAAAGGRPRAVILITGPGSTDASRFSPEVVRGYLRRLRVPLVVWSPEAPAAWSTWGEAARIRGRSQLLHAVRGVRSTVDRQLVVWLEGRHVPQEIELAPQAAGRLRPAG